MSFLDRVEKLVLNLRDDNIKQTYHDISVLAWEVAQEEFRKQEGKVTKLKITNRDIGFRKLMYDGKAFSDRDIPFEEWEDCAKAVLKVVKDYLDSDTADYEELPSSEERDKKFKECWDRLSEDPRYADRFIELMGY